MESTFRFDSPTSCSIFEQLDDKQIKIEDTWYAYTMWMMRAKKMQRVFSTIVWNIKHTHTAYVDLLWSRRDKHCQFVVVYRHATHWKRHNSLIAIEMFYLLLRRTDFMVLVFSVKLHTFLFLIRWNTINSKRFGGKNGSPIVMHAS